MMSIILCDVMRCSNRGVIRLLIHVYMYALDAPF